MAFNSPERFCLVQLNGLFVDQPVLVTIGTSSGVTTSKRNSNLNVVLDCRRKCLHRSAAVGGPVRQTLEADEVGCLLYRHSLDWEMKNYTSTILHNLSHNFTLDFS